MRLINAEERSSQNPSSFKIPSKESRDSIKEGDIVKLIFTNANNDAERMWVIVKEAKNHKYKGTLDNDPTIIKNLHANDEINFGPEHIIDIYED